MEPSLKICIATAFILGNEHTMPNVSWGLYCSVYYEPLTPLCTSVMGNVLEIRETRLYPCGPSKIGQASCDPSAAKKETTPGGSGRFRIDTEIPGLAPKTPHLQRTHGVPELGHLLTTPAHKLFTPMTSDLIAQAHCIDTVQGPLLL